MSPGDFPPEEGETYFVVKDNDGQQLASVHFDDPRSAAKPLTRRGAADCGEYRQAAGATTPNVIRAISDVRFRG
jgi:hypothetical protein